MSVDLSGDLSREMMIGSRRIAGRWCGIQLLAAVVAGGLGLSLPAQTCTTQSRMTTPMRSSMAEAGLAIAKSVQANDVPEVRSYAVPEFAANFAQTEDLVHRAATALAGDTLAVTQLYALDATARHAGDSAEAEFSCTLSGTTSETDFNIAALPPGFYGFAMVEGAGPRPYVVAMLLRREGSAWKLAGLYPRARTAAGHDGLWYWTAARDDSKAKQPWFSWLLYGEADELLRPANFVTSSNLDRLRSEQRLSLPTELAEGLGPETPYVVKAADGASYRFTGLAAEGAEDGKALNLVLHYAAEPIADANAARARNTLAAKAFLDVHPQLRQGFDGVFVSAESAGQPPVVTEEPMRQIP